MFSGEGFQTIGAICGVGALLWRLVDQVKPRGLQRRLHAVFMKEALRRVEQARRPVFKGDADPVGGFDFSPPGATGGPSHHG